MKRWSLMLAVVGLGMALTLGLAVSPALALSLQGNYYTLSSNHPDTLGGIDGATVTGLVLPALNGTAGTVGAAPVASGTSGPNSGAITDKNGANVIQWWTAHTTLVAVDNTVNGGVSNVRTDNFVGNVLGGPGFASGFYPNNNGNDGNGFRAVHWTGTFLVGAGGAHLTLSADDDAFLFLNGNLALDNGGVKAIGLSQTSSTNLAAGTYVVDLFFADRHQTQSGIAFSCEGCLDPVPEPTTLLLFGTTLAGVGAVVRRRLKGSKEVA
jgi:fibro-slime domain-containing protein